ncbi:myomegalin isoform X2 [Pseudophryne corroboree]|uniref:myomegalin isoform X2 n=1 Tax=Pseudophryne corroboree TaxID=495146 RepID=UPI0030818911
MLELKMKDVCRICGRELCGNQRRWIFHTAAKLNLQVVLSHVLNKEILRDGHAEFSCSKCAFMLERFYRFDTVIARIEALSIERLQKLLSEKDRLKHCLASLYSKNNSEDGQEAKFEEGTVDTPDLQKVQSTYSALLQEDFTFSGFEYWTELEEPSQEAQRCSHTEGNGSVPRKCHSCSSLRVPDSDYEAVCKVPRKIAPNVSCGHFSTCTSTFNEQIMSQISECEAVNVKVLEGEGLERLSSEYSVESLNDTKDAGLNSQKTEEKIKSIIENPKCICSSCNYASCSSAYGRKLDLALSLVKMFDYRPIQSPRGSRIPVKSSSVLKLNRVLSSGQSSSSNTGLGFLDSIVESPTRTSQDFFSAFSDLNDLWHNVYEDYIPLYSQKLNGKRVQDAMHYDSTLEQQAYKIQKAELEVQTLQEKLQESQNFIKTLQENQHQLTARLSTAEELAHNQECVLQSLRETLQSREHEGLELYQVIDDHNNTIAKLQDMALKSQSEHLQSFQVMPTQLQFLDLQNTLFSTQMELQKKQMALRQKERQLTDAKRSQRLLEVDLLEGQQQKETTWKHNQELHGALHNLQRELHEKNQHLKKLEEEKSTKLLAQEHSIQRLKQAVSQKEQMLQEYMEVLHCPESLDKIQVGNEHMLEKLRQRIKERDTALEQAVDDKFCALEEKEKEIQQLKMVIREREHDLERLSNILSGNEETINSLDNLVKAKDLELEQIIADYKNLQWLKQETEGKYRCSLNEREAIILQLQKTLQERNKEIEEMTACFLGKSEVGSGEMIEELKICLLRKEKMLQDAVFARSQQAEEHMSEVMELLTMISSEKMDQTIICQNCSVKEQQSPASVSQSVEHLTHFIHLQKFLQEKEKIIQAFTQNHSIHPMSICMKLEDQRAKGEENEQTQLLKSDLTKAKEDLRLVMRKMREYQLEVSALQSIIMKQNEQLREQAVDIDTLSRNIQTKEEFIKDLQMKLVDPEDIPTVELLTQQIFALKEKIISVDLASQGQLRQTQKLFKLLEELTANKSRLNEALQAERQLYSCLVQFHTEPNSFNASSALHNELLAAQALRGQLEDTLMRTMEQLVTLQSESKASTYFGGMCENNKSGDKTNPTNPFTENIEDANDASILRKDLQKLRRELHHLTNEKKNIKEELHILKMKIRDIEFYSTSEESATRDPQCPVTEYMNKNLHQDLNQQKLKLKVEEESGMSEQWMNKMKVKGVDLAVDVRKQQVNVSQDESVTTYQVDGLLDKKDPLNSNLTINMTKEIVYMAADMNDSVNKCQLREDEEEFQIPPTQEQLEFLYAKWPVTNLEKHSLQPHSETLNPGLQCTLMTSNVPTQTETNDGNHCGFLLTTDGREIKNESRQVQMDLQDLGYETCGKSENEVDPDDTSAEYDGDEDIFSKVNHTVEKTTQYKDRSHMSTVSSLRNNGLSDWNISLVKSEDAIELQQHVKKLKGQLLKSQKLIQDLQSQSRSSSHGSTSHSYADEDEGWQSDTAGVHQPAYLEQLSNRVSILETYFHNMRKDVGTPCQLKSVKGPGKYDWLIQNQARELSFIRQKMQEGRSVCHILTQHLNDSIKSFEEILRANDIDYYIGQSFREHLTQGSQLAVRLNSKLFSKGCPKGDEITGHELQANRLKRKILHKDKILETLQSALEDRPTSSNSSQASSESYGTSLMLDDQFSTNDVQDDCSEVSIASDYCHYEKGSIEDIDMCCHSSSVCTLHHSHAPNVVLTNKKEVYMIGHLDDFSALKKNILEGKALIYNMDTYIQSSLHVPTLEIHETKVMNGGDIRKLFSATRTLQNILDESNSLLNMFWKNSLPNTQISVQQKKQEQTINDEICTLRYKLKEQEILLHKASEEIKRTTLVKESMEKFIMRRLTSTCFMLKKARSNLQVRCFNKLLF